MSMGMVMLVTMVMMAVFMVLVIVVMVMMAVLMVLVIVVMVVMAVLMVLVVVMMVVMAMMAVNMFVFIIVMMVVMAVLMVLFVMVMVVAVVMVFMLGRSIRVSSAGMILAAFFGAMISMGFVLLISKKIKGMAMLVVAIIPIIIFYLFSQKYIIKGVVSGAVKG